MFLWLFSCTTECINPGHYLELHSGGCLVVVEGVWWWVELPKNRCVNDPPVYTLQSCPTKCFLHFHDLTTKWLSTKSPSLLNLYLYHNISKKTILTNCFSWGNTTNVWHNYSFLLQNPKVLAICSQHKFTHFVVEIRRGIQMVVKNGDESHGISIRKKTPTKTRSRRR